MTLAIKSVSSKLVVVVVAAAVGSFRYLFIFSTTEESFEVSGSCNQKNLRKGSPFSGLSQPSKYTLSEELPVVIRVKVAPRGMPCASWSDVAPSVDPVFFQTYLRDDVPVVR